MLFSAFERRVAWRYLRSRRQRDVKSWSGILKSLALFQEGFVSVNAMFSFLGIALGVAALIIVMSVFNGFHQDLLSRILGVNGHLAVYSNTGQMLNYQGLEDEIAKLPGVTSVNPLVEGQAMVMAHNQAMGIMVHGMRKEDLDKRDVISSKIQEGSLDSFKDPKTIAIGMRMAEKMGLMVGDKLKLVSPQGTETAFGNMPRSQTYTVGAIFEVGMHQYDMTIGFVPMETAQKFFGLGNGVTGLEVFTENPENVAEYSLPIYDLIQGNDYRIHDWQRVNSHFFTAVQVERNVMFIILTLIILVASFNVISSMIMLVKDKSRDIAILRTMGATRGMVMRIFFLTGSTVGVVGCGVGTLLGLLFCWNIESIRKFIEGLSGVELFSSEIYFLSKLPAKVDNGEVLLVIFVALTLTFLASIFPARKAAKLDPVEALRYE